MSARPNFHFFGQEVDAEELFVNSRRPSNNDNAQEDDAQMSDADFDDAASTISTDTEIEPVDEDTNELMADFAPFDQDLWNSYETGQQMDSFRAIVNTLLAQWTDAAALLPGIEEVPTERMVDFKVLQRLCRRTKGGLTEVIPQELATPVSPHQQLEDLQTLIRRSLPQPGPSSSREPSAHQLQLQPEAVRNIHAHLNLQRPEQERMFFMRTLVFKTNRARIDVQQLTRLAKELIVDDRFSLLRGRIPATEFRRRRILYDQSLEELDQLLKSEAWKLLGDRLDVLYRFADGVVDAWDAFAAARRRLETWAAEHLERLEAEEVERIDAH